MAIKPLPTQEALRQIFDYEPQTGKLLWRSRAPHSFPSNSSAHAKMWNRKFAGKVAGTITKRGYRAVTIGNTRFTAHRVIWKLMKGVEAKTVDHINGNGLDNRIENLRSVEQSENCKNSAMQSNNTSGYKGVCANGNKWNAYIKVSGRKWHIGDFETLRDAVTARKFAERVFGFHPNHGRQHPLHRLQRDR